MVYSFDGVVDGELVGLRAVAVEALPHQKLSTNLRPLELLNFGVVVDIIDLLLVVILVCCTHDLAGSGSIAGHLVMLEATQPILVLVTGSAELAQGVGFFGGVDLALGGGHRGQAVVVLACT